MPRMIFLKEMPLSTIKHKMQIEAALGSLVGRFYFSPHLSKLIIFSSVPPSFKECWYCLLWLISRFRAVCEQDFMEDTKFPVAGIACKAPMSKGITIDRHPSFSEDGSLCSTGESCSIPALSGSDSGRSLRHMLNFKGVLNSFPWAGLLSPVRAKANAVFNFWGINLEFFMSPELGRRAFNFSAANRFLWLIKYDST